MNKSSLHRALNIQNELNSKLMEQQDALNMLKEAMFITNKCIDIMQDGRSCGSYSPFHLRWGDFNSEQRKEISLMAKDFLDENGWKLTFNVDTDTFSIT